MSIWGTDIAPFAVTVPAPGADVVCAAGVETNVMFASIGPLTSNQNYTLVALVSVAILLGATPPSALAIAARQYTNADYDSFLVLPNLLTASAAFVAAGALVGIFARGSIYPVSTVINITVAPTGQPVTCRAAYSRAVFVPVLGADT